MRLWQKSADVPLVAGCILAYNKLDFVRDCIASAVLYGGLDRGEYDLRVWDQGSPYEGVSAYLQSLDWPPVEGGGFNVGVGAALNNVIEMTDSEYFFKLDDDCTLLPMTLPLLVLTYALCRSSGFPVAVLSADVLGVGKAQGPYEEVEVAPGLTIECAPCVGGGCVLIGRDVLEDVGPFRADRLYGVEDGDFASRALQKGYRNAYLRGAYHVSRCRSEEADPQIDNWKLAYYSKTTDLAFDEWRGKC